MNTLAFDHTPDAHLVELAHEWATDIRHIQLLHAIGVMFSPLNTIVEIGSFKGASTLAFRSLLNAGHAQRLICVEPNTIDSLKAVLSACSGKTEIVPTLPAVCAPDFVYIDGDHGAQAVKDIMWALGLAPLIICLHDTNTAKLGNPACWGAEQAACWLKESEHYLTFEDRKERPNERTDRGFMVGIRTDVADDLSVPVLRALMETDGRWWEKRR